MLIVARRATGLFQNLLSAIASNGPNIQIQAASVSTNSSDQNQLLPNSFMSFFNKIFTAFLISRPPLDDYRIR
ncbi:hypothetical protein [Pseudomonas syringae]|uniref:hypothetical protein n=1 Tax=Pseudomonas syringae TaxID=317 RepID=UPI0034D40A50